jgi:hypothetical protein
MVGPQSNRRVNRAIVTSTLAACLALLGIFAQAADYTLTVDAAAPKAPTAHMQGFLHGFQPQGPYPHPELVGTNLRPAFWRTARWTNDRAPYDAIRAVTTMNPKITMELSGLFASVTIGGIEGIHPPSDPDEWDAWKEKWRTHCEDQVKISLGLKAAPGQTLLGILRPVDYWEVWNETDLEFFYRGTWSQLLEIHQIACEAVRGVYDANNLQRVPIVGPAKATFRKPFKCDPNKDLFDFISELANDYGTRLDGISWHSNGIYWIGPEKYGFPKEIPGDADELRDFLNNFVPAYDAELHINEHANSAQCQIPGWVVAYKYYAEQADLDWLSLSGWKCYIYTGSELLPKALRPKEYWKSSDYGLGGLFMKNMVTVQQPYYAHWTYKIINDSDRIVVTSTDPDVSGLAARNDTRSKLVALVGFHRKKFSHVPPAFYPVDVKFTNWPWPESEAIVKAWRFTDENETDGNENDTDGHPHYWAHPALHQPGDVDRYMIPTQTLSVVNGTVTYPISFADGDAYRIEAIRFPATLLDDNVENGGVWDGNYQWTADSDFHTTNEKSKSPTRSRKCGPERNKLESLNLDTTGKASITISFWYNEQFIDSNNKAKFEVRNSSGAWVKLKDLNAPATDENKWLYYSVTLTDPSYFHANFRIRFEASALDSLPNKFLWVDDIKVIGNWD